MALVIDALVVCAGVIVSIVSKTEADVSIIEASELELTY
jgi:hypothetical protein